MKFTPHFVLGVLFLVTPAFVSADHIQACTMEYAPVCGAREVQCVRAPCYPVYETFGNKCSLEAAHAQYVHAGECRGDETGPYKPGPMPPQKPIPMPMPGFTPPASCTAWFDGCNTCTRTENGSACTKRYCATPSAGYCKQFETSTSTSGTSSAPATKPIINWNADEGTKQSVKEVYNFFGVFWRFLGGLFGGR